MAAKRAQELFGARTLRDIAALVLLVSGCAPPPTPDPQVATVAITFVDLPPGYPSRASGKEFRFLFYATPEDRTCADLEAMVVPPANLEVELLAHFEVRRTMWPQPEALDVFPVPEGGRVFGVVFLSEVLHATFCSAPVPPQAASIEVHVHLLGTRPGPSMNAARARFSAIHVAGDRVLVAGGSRAGPTLEMYEPATNEWRLLPPLIISHYLHAATALLDGRVLITGGVAPSGRSAMPRVEVVDPSTGVSTMVTSMEIPREMHAATRLLDGRVLVTGGRNGAGGVAPAEVYEPDAGTWTVVGSMLQTRYRHTATLLADGTVLIVGGEDDATVPLTSTELYDPASGTFSAGPQLEAPRWLHVAVVLADGSVLIAGGADASAERYVPAQRSFVPAGRLMLPERNPCAALLPSGQVALVGKGQLVEVFDPALSSWSARSVLSVGRDGCAAWPLADGGLMVVGGDDAQHLASSEVVVP